MMNDRKIKYLIKKCKKCEKYKTTKIYLFLILFSLFITVFVTFFTQNRINSLKVVIVFFSSSFFLSFFYFLLNWVLLTSSLKNLKNMVSNFNVLPSEVFETYYGSLSFNIHPYILCHPVALFFIGNIMYILGYEQDGTHLINKAEQYYPGLNKIKRGRYFESVDKEYLINLLNEDMRLKSSFRGLELWKIKSIRYTIIIIGSLIFLIYYLIKIIEFFW